MKRGFQSHRRGCRLQNGFDPFLQLPLGQGADFGAGDFAALEHHQRRNAAHAVFRRRHRVVVDVQLGDGQPIDIWKNLIFGIIIDWL